MTIALIVPVFKNFKGFTELIASIDEPVLPFVHPNWIANEGVSAAWNSQLDTAIDHGCELALICNDDVRLLPGTIRKLIESMNEFDLVSPNPGTPSLSTVYEYPADYACFMIKPSQFVQRFGRFDETFSPAYFEDNDMRYRVKIAGGREAMRLDAGMHHDGSVTQNWNGQRVVSHEMFRANEQYYIDKWGGKPYGERYQTAFNKEDK